MYISKSNTQKKPLNPQIPKYCWHAEKMKTPPRESAKSHKSLEQCRDKALQRFLSETKGRREGLIARFRSCPQSGRGELIKTWLLQQPPYSPSRGGNVLMPEELDWEGFLDSVQYEELLLELEGAMMDDIAAEEAAAREDCSMEEDEQNMMDEESVGPDAVLCPVCWYLPPSPSPLPPMHLMPRLTPFCRASSLIWNPGTHCLHCSCGTWVNLAHSQLTPQGFRSALGEVFDRCAPSHSHRALIHA